MSVLNPVWVKICGVRTVEAALHAQASGADAIGINLHAPSPRFVRPAMAKKIQAAISIPAYLVVVNQSLTDLKRLRDEAQPSGFQFHGENPEAIANALGHPFLAAYRADEKFELTLSKIKAKRILLDAFHPKLHGGTGLQVDHDLALMACLQKEVILAGGLNPDNVADIVQSLPLWGVDVASGVEHSPGKQDFEKIAAFISSAKQAQRGAIE